MHVLTASTGGGVLKC